MNTPINTAMQWRHWGLLWLLSILWGGSFFFVEVAIVELPPLTVVLCRVGGAAAALWAIVLFMRLPLPSRPAVWGSFAAMGLINNVLPFSLIAWGQIYITSGLASILNATMPLFTILVAAALLADEHLTRGKIIGVLLGIAGTVLMVGVAALDGFGDNVLAMLAVLAAAVSYAFATVFGRRFRAWGVPPIVTAAGQTTGSTLILIPFALALEQPLQLAFPSTSVVLALVGLAVLSTAFAYIIYFNILASSGAVNISLVTLLLPVSTILLGVLLLDETLHQSHIAGMALIALGLAAIDGRVWRRLKGGDS